MKLFRSITTKPAPVVPRESLALDPDLLSTIWTMWLTAQPTDDKDVLARHDRTGESASLAIEVAAEPIRKLLWLRAAIAGVLSQIVDTLIFVTVAFYGVFPIAELMVGQMIAKVVLSALLVPLLIYGFVALGRSLDRSAPAS